jgi:hypothetical protein
MDSGTAGTTTAPAKERRPPWLVMAFILCGAAVALARLGPPPPGTPRPRAGGLRWWVTPVARDAEAGLAAIDADLYAVRAVSDRRVWVGGSRGTLAHSDDGGLTWVKEVVHAAPVLEPAPVAGTNDGQASGPVPGGVVSPGSGTDPPTPPRLVPATMKRAAKKSTPPPKPPLLDFPKASFLDWLIPTAEAKEPPPAYPAPASEATPGPPQGAHSQPEEITIQSFGGPDHEEPQVAFGDHGRYNEIIRRDGRWAVAAGSTRSEMEPSRSLSRATSATGGGWARTGWCWPPTTAARPGSRARGGGRWRASRATGGQRCGRCRWPGRCSGSGW